MGMWEPFGLTYWADSNWPSHIDEATKSANRDGGWSGQENEELCPRFCAELRQHYEEQADDWVFKAIRRNELTVCCEVIEINFWDSTDEQIELVRAKHLQFLGRYEFVEPADKVVNLFLNFPA
jgi:hypothetical protein